MSLLLGSFRVALPPEESGLFLWGVVCASCLWFLSLTTISSLFKNRFTPRLLRIINLVCGLVIFFYGVKLGWSFVELCRVHFECIGEGRTTLLPSTPTALREYSFL